MHVNFEPVLTPTFQIILGHLVFRRLLRLSFSTRITFKRIDSAIVKLKLPYLKNVVWSTCAIKRILFSPTSLLAPVTGVEPSQYL